MKRRKLTHIQIIALGFFIIILTGSLLLMLPVSSADGTFTSPVSAVFTATSASCVTGLVVVNTATHWSVFGKCVIISLIQIGGLGFMTIATFFYRLVIKKHGLRERVIMAESINTARLSDFSVLIKKIVFGTFIVEGIGAILLSTRFIPRYGFLKGILFSIFHSVSAFCNAGFDILGETEPYCSLVPFYDDIIVNITIILLILIGGIGFLVWDDITVYKFKFKRLSLHSKLAISVTAVLTVLGAVLFSIFEYNATCADMGIKERILTSFFNSVTPRTAGFNTVDTAALSDPSKILTMIYMFIGGSSGSTAGGVKTTTVIVLLGFAISSIRGKSDIHIFERKINTEIFKKAVLIVLINFSLAIFGTITISAIQNIPLTDIMFETMSAIGTVGMSTGITRDLNTLSRIIIIFLMYCGRVGSISFASALFQKRIKSPVSYPEENITVG